MRDVRTAALATVPAQESEGKDGHAAEYSHLPVCPAFKQIGELRGESDLGLMPTGACVPRWRVSSTLSVFACCSSFRFCRPFPLFEPAGAKPAGTLLALCGRLPEPIMFSLRRDGGTTQRAEPWPRRPGAVPGRRSGGYASRPTLRTPHHG